VEIYNFSNKVVKFSANLLMECIQGFVLGIDKACKIVN
jgi:hypothetical protein